MSYIAWLDHSEHERRKMLDVIDLFREHETVDELGIGGVRDAFANLMLPGTSTIQTRARYFLFIPWIYKGLEKKRIASKDIAARARREEKRLKERLDAAQRSLVEARPHLRIAPAPDGVFTATLNLARKHKPPASTQTRIWPITQRQELAKEPTEGAKAIDLGLLSFEGLTSFVAFEIEAEEKTHRATRRFVLNLPTEGMPEGRREKILRWLLKDPAQVLRLLLLLLADSPEEGVEALLQGRRDKGGAAGLAPWGERQILESLLHALDRGPERLDQMAGLVADLEADPETKSLIPDGFHDIWAPIWEARKRLKGEKGTAAA
jgi:hypothetical protein